jgi:hypothetical protein
LTRGFNEGFFMARSNSKQNALMGSLSDFIRRHPKTSATIAFNLGIYAALATKKGLSKGISKSDLQRLPAKVAELVPDLPSLASLPSLPELRGYLPGLLGAGTEKAASGNGRKRPAKRQAKRAKTVKRNAKRRL